MTSQTSQNTWTITDNRSSSDWGSLTKSSTSSQSLTKVRDGQYHHVATQSETAPPPPPSFGETQYAFGTETLTYEADMEFDNDFGVTKTITRADRRLFDSFGDQVSMAELTKPASYTASRTAGQVLSPLGSFDVKLDETVCFGYPTPDPGDPGQNYIVKDELTRELLAGEFVERGTITGPAGSVSYYIDAPRQGTCGCGCGASGCDCGGADETTVGDVVGIAAGVGVATGVCTWGTIVTTPAVITGVGALVPAGVATVCAAGGAVWWLTWEWWH